MSLRARRSQNELALNNPINGPPCHIDYEKNFSASKGIFSVIMIIASPKNANSGCRAAGLPKAFKRLGFGSLNELLTKSRR